MCGRARLSSDVSEIKVDVARRITLVGGRRVSHRPGPP